MNTDKEELIHLNDFPEILKNTTKNQKSTRSKTTIFIMKKYSETINNNNIIQKQNEKDYLKQN